MTYEAMAIPITSERQIVRALVCGWGSWVLHDTGHTQEAREALIEGHNLCLQYDDHLILGSILDGLGFYAPDYMSPEVALAALQQERSWLQDVGISDRAGPGVTASYRVLMSEHRWAEALREIDALLALPEAHWRQTFFWNLQRAALLQLLGRPEEALSLDEQLYLEARTVVDRHHALCDRAIAKRDAGDLDGSERDVDEAMQYLLDGHNPVGGWGVAPTPTLVGWLLIVKATLRLARGDDDAAAIARIVGVGYGLISTYDFDMSFEIARITHGYEDRLPDGDGDARAFAITASLANAVGYALQ
jgi:tetratricopeptide (TPR) repeat protein